jgi:hypothetical protein
LRTLFFPRISVAALQYAALQAMVALFPVSLGLGVEA